MKGNYMTSAFVMQAVATAMHIHLGSCLLAATLYSTPEAGQEARSLLQLEVDRLLGLETTTEEGESFLEYPCTFAAANLSTANSTTGLKVCYCSLYSETSSVHRIGSYPMPLPAIAT